MDVGKQWINPPFSSNPRTEEAYSQMAMPAHLQYCMQVITSFLAACIAKIREFGFY
jgi:hypothetical protein